MTIHGSDLPPGIHALAHYGHHEQILTDEGWQCDCGECRGKGSCQHAARAEYVSGKVLSRDNVP